MFLEFPVAREGRLSEGLDAHCHDHGDDRRAPDWLVTAGHNDAKRALPGHDRVAGGCAVIGRWSSTSVAVGRRGGGVCVSARSGVEGAVLRR
jgi:hypothetical protein